MPSSHFGRIGAVASLLRKEACSGSVHDLAHNPTQNCLADCLTKASAKADNLITAVKRGRLLDVDIHSHFRTLVEHKAFLSTWCRTFMHTRDKEVFFLNSLKISLAPTLQERPFQVMFAGTQQTQKELNLSVRARCYENNVCLRRFLHPISLVSDADSDDNADMDGKTLPIETPSRSSQRRSMKQDLLDSIISFTC